MSSLGQEAEVIGARQEFADKNFAAVLCGAQWLAALLFLSKDNGRRCERVLAYYGHGLELIVGFRKRQIFTL